MALVAGSGALRTQREKVSSHTGVNLNASVHSELVLCGLPSHLDSGGYPWMSACHRSHPLCLP